MSYVCVPYVFSYCLSQEPDFLSQKEWLTEVVETRGHEIIFYPKFHCELNYIENIWAFVKSYLRRTCTYSFPDLQAKIPDVLENKVEVPFVRRIERHCLRFMSGYRQGLEGPLLDYAMKKYSSHRRIPENVTKEIIEQTFVLDSSRKRKL